MSGLTTVIVWLTFMMTLIKTVVWLNIWSMFKLMMKEEQK